jgi:hypothetical protein
MAGTARQAFIASLEEQAKGVSVARWVGQELS